MLLSADASANSCSSRSLRLVPVRLAYMMSWLSMVWVVRMAASNSHFPVNWPDEFTAIRCCSHCCWVRPGES
jgi:hypothetical protein